METPVKVRKCRYWRFYKGVSPSTCNCDACEANRIEEKKEKNLKRPTVDECPDPTECEDGCCGYCSEVDDLTEDCVEFMERNS